MNKDYTLESSEKEFFKSQGYLKVESIISPDEINSYREIYDKFLSGEIDSKGRRSDLGGHVDKKKKDAKENVTQIMWPSDAHPPLAQMPCHQRALAIAKSMLGDDMELDFDMLIDKAPGTETPTPWHQDAAYWPNLEDKRAATCWVALDEATVENGCMWFVAESNQKPLRKHWQAGKGGGALECEATEDEAVAVPLKAGSCTFHDGKTLHYSRGNSTNGHRRALILNFRPRAAIEEERRKGFDHGLNTSATERVVRNDSED